MTAHTSFTPRVLLRGEDCEGAAGIVEITVPPRWEGPPLHHHPFAEAFYVLDGELTFQLGDALRTATAGDFLFARSGAVHTLANRAGATARYVLVITPAGFERYFDRIAAEAVGVEPPPSARQPYPETTVVGPQIAQ
jgi:quercetin dioxygenase-like cupin family protein